jgi:hypothetical protein
MLAYKSTKTSARLTVAAVSKESRASTSVDTRPGTIARIFAPKVQRRKFTLSTRDWMEDYRGGLDTVECFEASTRI